MGERGRAGLPAPGELSAATRLVAGARPEATPDAPLNEPVTFASTYHAGGSTAYGRYGNPTWTAFEQLLGDLEGGRALAFASGLAASTAVLSILTGAGAVIVAPDNAYLGVLDQVRELEAAGAARMVQVDVTVTDRIADAAQSASVVWLESPTNPNLDVADIAAAARAARAAGAVTVVDNTFATPLRQRPLDLGADIVVHSATKLLAGHSDVVLGAVVVADDAVYERVDGYRRLHGAVPGPMETFLALRGMRTLELRLDRAEENAAELARRLREHHAVQRVRYPGFGTMVSIEVAGDAAAANRVVGAVELWVHSTSLGGVESSLERRRHWPTESVTVAESLLRLSVGIEDVGDLWDDLSRALETATT